MKYLILIIFIHIMFQKSFSIKNMTVNQSNCRNAASLFHPCGFNIDIGGFINETIHCFLYFNSPNATVEFSNQIIAIKSQADNKCPMFDFLFITSLRQIKLSTTCGGEIGQVNRTIKLFNHAKFIYDAKGLIDTQTQIRMSLIITNPDQNVCTDSAASTLSGYWWIVIPIIILIIIIIVIIFVCRKLNKLKEHFRLKDPVKVPDNEHVYNCADDSKMMNSKFRNIASMKGYAYHVTNVDCCGKTDENILKIDWDGNQAKINVELDPGETPAKDEGNPREPLISGELQINDTENNSIKDVENRTDQIQKKTVLKAFEIKETSSNQVVKGVFLSTDLHHEQLPDRTVYPLDKLDYPVDHFYQRISIKFEEISEKYPKCQFWYLRNYQIHYICYDEDGKIENIKGINLPDEFQLYNNIGESEISKLNIKKEGATKEILPLLQNNHSKGDYFCTILVLGDVEISKNAKIDIVQKQYKKF